MFIDQLKQNLCSKYLCRKMCITQQASHFLSAIGASVTNETSVSFQTPFLQVWVYNKLPFFYYGLSIVPDNVKCIFSKLIMVCRDGCNVSSAQILTHLNEHKKNSVTDMTQVYALLVCIQQFRQEWTKIVQEHKKIA